MNKWVDEAGRNAGLSRLTLFSPCKVSIRSEVGASDFPWVLFAT